MWNYQDKMVQILEITQATIQRAMKIKIDNRQGDAMGYDFIITKTGDGLQSEYDIDTGNPEPVTSDAMVEFTKKKINLEALFDGGDPFNSNASSQPQNESTAHHNWNRVGNSMPQQNKPQESNVAPDVQEYADQIQNGDEGNPFFNE